MKLKPGLFVAKQNKNKTNLQIGAYLIGIASLATKKAFLLHCNSGVVKSPLTYCNEAHFLKRLPLQRLAAAVGEMGEPYVVHLKSIFFRPVGTGTHCEADSIVAINSTSPE